MYVLRFYNSNFLFRKLAVLILLYYSVQDFVIDRNLRVLMPMDLEIKNLEFLWGVVLTHNHNYVAPLYVILEIVNSTFVVWNGIPAFPSFICHEAEEVLFDRQW